MESNKSTETLSLRTKEKNNKVSKGYSLNNSLQYVKNKNVDSLLSRNIPSTSRKLPSKLTPNQQNTRNKIMSLMKRSSDFVAEIRQTKHYEWFEYVKGNRDIYKSQIKKLSRSYSRIILNTKAIICYVDINYKTGKWILKIVDGQHTYETRKSKQMSIPFVIDQALNPNNALEAITEVNSTVKKWINQDFLTSLSMMGKKSYQLFKEVQQKYMPVDNELLFYILNKHNDNRTDRRPYISHDNFKEGGLVFNDKDKQFLDDRLADLSKFNVYSKLGGKRYFNKALSDLLETNFIMSSKSKRKFDVGQMLNKLKLNKWKIVKVNTVDGALDELARLYNNRSTKGRIQFTTVSESNRTTTRLVKMVK